MGRDASFLDSGKHSANVKDGAMVWITGDDPDATIILAAYWPYGGSNRPPPERKARALQALVRVRPDISEAQAQEKVEKIILAEQEEYRIALTFCQMAIFYIGNINQILEDISVCSGGLPDLKGVSLREQCNYIWSQLTALLSYAGSLHRVLLPQINIQKRDRSRERKLKSRERRRRILRFYLNYDEDILQELNSIRGIQQHFDEHIDEFINGGQNYAGKSIVDHVIVNGNMPENAVFLRSFDPNSLTLKILDTSYCLRRLKDFFPLFIMVVTHNVYARGGRYHIHALSLSGAHI